jgi:diadenosine tetraphosphatase ApaH/serine/threonine PP2A family protein phosphatase
VPRTAIVSDIHANVRALEAVLADIERRREADRIFSLGDVVGYGPRPNDCLAHARAFHLRLRGNHEQAVIHGARDFNPMAKRAIDWTRHTILPDPQAPSSEQLANWNLVTGMAERHVEGRALFVHGAPQDPINEYILPMDIDPVHRTYGRKLHTAFQLTPWVTFCGHSHFPALYSETGQYVSPTLQKEVTVKLDDRVKHIVNVGSVGQPRDGDNRACYVVWDDEACAVTWRRVHYDIQDMFNQIFAVGALDDTLGERLFRGQ